MRGEEECEPGSYRPMYFLHICKDKPRGGGARAKRRNRHKDFINSQSANQRRSPREVSNLSQRSKELRSLFDKASREYDEVRPGYPRELIGDIIRISSIPRNGGILEVGCGTGQATISFAALGYSMLCLDVGGNLVEVAREKFRNYPNVEIQCISFEEWEPQRNAFDLLISATAFHWIPPEVGYSKAAEVLKETGYLALFWNMHPKPYTGFFEDVQTVYRDVVPEWVIEPEDSQETEKKIQEREDYINKTGLFEEAKVKRYPWSRVYSTNQYLKLLNTYSDHRSIEEHREASLYAGIKRLIDEKYDGRIVRPYLSVLYIAKKKAS